MAKSGGLVTLEDLAAYQPLIRKPVIGVYRGLEVVSFPPPSSGGVALVETLNILEGFDLAALGAGSSASWHRIAEALKLAFVDRNTFLGDMDFVDVPIERLTAKSYADTLRSRINPARWRRGPWTWGRSEVAIEVRAPGLPVDDAGTTHLSTVDANGGAVALTMTINSAFRLRHDGAGHRRDPEQRDGRLLEVRQRPQHLRPDRHAGRKRHRPGQTTAVEHDAHYPLA